MATRARKLVAKEPAGEPARPRDAYIPEIARLSSDLRTLFVNAFLLLAFVLFVPVIVAQFMRTQVLIEPLAVPAALVARGLDGNVAANRLWDGIDDATKTAATSKAGIDTIPANQHVDFSIPDSGVSIDALVYYVRQFFHGYETRISGELRCADEACTPSGISLRLRILRDHLDVIQLPALGAGSEADYFKQAGIGVLQKLDPFTAAAAIADQSPVRAMAQAQQLLVTHHPDAKWAANLIGSLRINAGDTDGAIAAFQQAAQIDPSFLIARVNLASALTVKADYAGAQKLLDQLARTTPQTGYLAIAEAKLAAAQGQTDSAIKLMLDADTRDPGTPKYDLVAAQIALNAGRPADVVDYASRALLTDPANYDAVTLVYSIEISQGASDKAEQVLQQALAYAPDAHAIERELALVLNAEGKLPLALQHIEHALTEAPASTDYQILRAQTLYYLGRNADALSQLDATATVAPDNFKIAMAYGDVYAALDRTAEAIAAYQRVVDLDPDPDDVAEAKRRIAQVQPTQAPAAPAG